jgi:hypothetical protein
MIEADVEERWVRAIRELIETKNPGPILNVDETSWRLYPTGILTWAETGAEDVPVNVSGDLKECVTVLVTISADVRKLPLVIIAAGKTERVEVSQLGDVGEHVTDHSLSGWTTSETPIALDHQVRFRKD